jgi:hypothetical protein
MQAISQLGLVWPCGTEAVNNIHGKMKQVAVFFAFVTMRWLT